MAASLKQIEANRRNGKLGGVKTAEGKRRSSQNAVTHGLFCRSPLVKTALYKEDAEEFDRHLEGLKLNYPGEEVELVQSRFDLAWIALETGRVRNRHRLMQEQGLRDAQSGLAKKLFEMKEELNSSKNKLLAYHVYMEKIECWKPDFSPEQIPKEDLETILKSARDVYDRYRTGKMTADNTESDVLEIAAIMPEPTVATFGNVCRCLLTLYKLTIGIVEARVEEQQLDYDRLLIRKNELPIQLILPESEQHKLFEYLDILRNHRDKTIARIQFIIDHRPQRVTSLLESAKPPNATTRIRKTSKKRK